MTELGIAHERIHVEQYERFGVLGFLARYLWFNLWYGYEMNPLEVEARVEARNRIPPDTWAIVRREPWQPSNV